jgi:iron-sulfur cluster assembly protein
MITLTDKAVEHIRNARCGMKAEKKSLRVSVVHGGCSGNQYKVDFDNVSPGDTEFQSNGVTILVDEHSLPLVKKMEMDYVEDLKGSSFVFKNPNTQECCCGQSFNA